MAKKERKEREEGRNITDLAPRWNQQHRKIKKFKRIKNITSFVYHDDEKNLIHFIFSFSWCLSFLMCFFLHFSCTNLWAHVDLNLMARVSERKRINSISLYTKSSNTKSIIFHVISPFKKGNGMNLRQKWPETFQQK